MRVRAAGVVGALALTTVWAGLGGAPASAAVTVSRSGTTMTVNATGGTPVSVTCTAGEVRAGGLGTSPAMPCTTITTLTVLGDASGNYIDLEQVGAAFTALGSVVVSPGGGANLVFTSPKREVYIGSGDGQDQVWLDATGAADGPISLGGDPSDTVNVEAGAGDDTVSIVSGTSTRTDVSRGSWSAAITGTPFLGISAGDGDDVVDASTLGASALLSLSAVGGAGDDVLRGGPITNVFRGGTGTNTIVGGPEADVITSESPTDTIQGLGDEDTISDQGSGRVGGRTFVGPATEDDLWVVRADGDVVFRSRSGAAGTSLVTAALGRTGVQVLGGSTGWINYSPDGPGLPADRVLFDVAALTSHPQRITSTSATTLVDLVVPSGVWTQTGGTIDFSGPYQDVIVPSLGTVNVRTPFVDPEQRFAHRVLRDLEVRIPGATERDTYRFQLESGGLTRAQMVLQLTSTDVVRGIAVDRAFVDIMRRATDIPGRAYWVGRLRDGLVIRRMRANLYGSNEYFDVQGDGSVEEYVRSAYRDILGRDAEESGLGYWVDLIEGGTPRGTVADRFLNTTEARTVVIRDLFLRWVDREPTPTETSTWLTQLGSSTVDGEAALIRFLAGSAAYFTRPDA